MPACFPSACRISVAMAAVLAVPVESRAAQPFVATMRDDAVSATTCGLPCDGTARMACTCARDGDSVDLSQSGYFVRRLSARVGAAASAAPSIDLLDTDSWAPARREGGVDAAGCSGEGLCKPLKEKDFDCVSRTFRKDFGRVSGPDRGAAPINAG